MQPANLQVRRAEIADLPAISRLEHACFADPWGEDSLRSELTQSIGRAWVVDREDCPAMLLGWLVADEFQVNRVAVLPQARGQGLGRALMVRALLDAQSCGATRALLEVRADNVAALALYRRLGFGDLSRRKGYYSDGSDALVLDLPLPTWTAPPAKSQAAAAPAHMTEMKA